MRRRLTEIPLPLREGEGEGFRAGRRECLLVVAADAPI